MSALALTAQQISELVVPTISAAGYDVDDLRTTATEGSVAITVIVDGDDGVTLDALGALTHDVVELLDAAEPDGEYTLEITTPGVDRPLTELRHWRRAQGRKVTIDHVGPDHRSQRVTGRIGASTDAAVALIRNERGRFTTTEIDLKSITKAVVQVDFRPPNATELELCGLDADAIAKLTRTMTDTSHDDNDK